MAGSPETASGCAVCPPSGKTKGLVGQKRRANTSGYAATVAQRPEIHHSASIAESAHMKWRTATTQSSAATSYCVLYQERPRSTCSCPLASVREQPTSPENTAPLRCVLFLRLNPSSRVLIRPVPRLCTILTTVRLPPSQDIRPDRGGLRTASPAYLPSASRWRDGRHVTMPLRVRLSS